MTSAIADALRLPSGPVDLTAIDPDSAPGFDGKKADGKAALAGMQPELADLQERLWAERTAGSERRVLLVLQGMDTSGKGGVLRHTIGLVDPQGVRITSFKAPTEEERAHDFLWRIEKGLPEAGYIGVFDRSHYEDVLIARVHGLADPDEIERRYGAINEFEARLVDEGFSVLKCMLHISADEQKARLAERLANPEKHWKFNPGDLDERAHWPAYREAYEIALERTGTDIAPWHVVPADKKWFRNLAVGQILLDTLRGLDLQWPTADFDVTAETERLAAEAPVR
ncbi:polyphosphate kinase 2 family protein [Nocardioides ganghwensis]|jgi:PPK2 family polyphosphate:nucleotide phosphotransferase|uniref:Polyphosphate kinase 2 family protein n=1 Tax=Nocardioides ganghwensis TaxID=252230 RepID=A0A4Q2SIJ3_9ACTN|nr:polyphosphate kinase 2 family protein [Nocardioides ganghwensis]MBD3945255.1 polyphosphate kinase 2 family protein [Nocardioides ganghwensis]RYC03678.1 polyphosphate kinase 2 family protein [Nocardioides ganghwensis]